MGAGLRVTPHFIIPWPQLVSARAKRHCLKVESTTFESPPPGAGLVTHTFNMLGLVMSEGIIHAFGPSARYECCCVGDSPLRQGLMMNAFMRTLLQALHLQGD